MKNLMRHWLAIALLWGMVATASAQRIDHVEPTSWWTGMRDSRLQLMVHGERISELEPAVKYSGVTLGTVTRTDNPNYLFIDLALAPDTQPGKFNIEFRRSGRTVLKHEYQLHARNPAAGSGFGPQDVIYLITPDRFANRKPRNDNVSGYREKANRADPQGRHGGDLAGVRSQLDYIANMGFTQIWLNPVLQNNQPEASYHGYAATDFYSIDARFGDNELYRSLATAARERGIGLIKDIVLNHCGSEHWWMRDLPARDWINHGGHFVATSHNQESLLDPHGSESDRAALRDGWFVPTMPDLNQRNPLLSTYLIQNTLWWIEYAGLSGLRVDTWPYSDRTFLTEWTRRVLEEYPLLGIVGEAWHENPAMVAYWQRGTVRADGYMSHLPNLFDFPLQVALSRGLVEREDGPTTGLTRIYRTLANDFLYREPNNLVIFADNHDMSRVFTQLGEDLDLYKMAIGFVLTTRGIPQLYYGSELLMSHPGSDAHGLIRSDFPGGWRNDAVNGFTGTGLSEAQRSAQDFTRRLLNWRKQAPAIKHGRLSHYAPANGTYVYFRHTDAQKIMIVLNKSTQPQQLDTTRFSEVIGSDVLATDILSGQKYDLKQTLPLTGRGITVLELRER